MRTEDSASSSDYLEKKKHLQVPNKSSSSRTTQLQYRTLLDLTEPGDPVSRFQVLLDPASPSFQHPTTQHLTTCPMFIPPKIQTIPCVKKQKPILHNFLQSLDLQEH